MSAEYSCSLCGDGVDGIWKFPASDTVIDEMVKRDFDSFVRRLTARQKKSLTTKIGCLCLKHFHEEDVLVDNMGKFTLKNPDRVAPYYIEPECDFDLVAIMAGVKSPTVANTESESDVTIGIVPSTSSMNMADVATGMAPSTSTVNMAKDMPGSSSNVLSSQGMNLDSSYNVLSSQGINVDSPEDDYSTSPNEKTLKARKLLSARKRKSRMVSRKISSGSSVESRKWSNSRKVSDFDYTPSSQTSNSSASGVQQQLSVSNANTIVNDAKLLLLLKYCPNCGVELDTTKIIMSGFEGARKINWYCATNTCYKTTCSWVGQQYIQARNENNRLSSINKNNLDFVAATVGVGSTYKVQKKISDSLNLVIPSEKLFYRVQKHCVLPAVAHLYEKKMNAVYGKLEQRLALPNQSLVIAGDARFSSPGFSAEACTYNFIDLHSNEVLWSQSKSRRDPEVRSSPAMELELFQAGLQFLKGKFPEKISIVTSDASISIANEMRINHPEIKHCLDLWHTVKLFEKRLALKCKLKRFEKLKAWLPAIRNHILFCSGEACKAGGDKVVAKELLQSLYYHIQDIHTWGNNENFGKVVKCMHPTYEESRRSTTSWLKKGVSEENDACLQYLHLLLHDQNLVKYMEQTAEYLFTSDLESLHAVQRSYAEKRLSFSVEGYDARMKLAVMQWNENRNRAVLKDSDGNEKLFKKKTKSRIGSRLCLTAKMVAQTMNFRKDLLNETQRQWCDMIKASKTLASTVPVAPREYIKVPDVEHATLYANYQKQKEHKLAFKDLEMEIATRRRKEHEKRILDLKASEEVTTRAAVQKRVTRKRSAKESSATPRKQLKR